MSIRREVAAVAGAAILVTVLVAVRDNSSLLGTLAGVVIAPFAVWAVHGLGTRLAGARFALAAAAVYVALPLAAVAYFLPPYRSTYADSVLPTLVGVEHSGWLALGAAVAACAWFVPQRVLAGGGVAAAVVAVSVWGLGALGEVKVGLHEGGWSIALLEWLPVAGAAGAARRSPWLAAALAGWLVAVVLHAAHASFSSGAFWRELAPALPAAALLAASIALLVPRLRPAPRRSPADAP